MKVKSEFTFMNDGMYLKLEVSDSQNFPGNSFRNF